MSIRVTLYNRYAKFHATPDVQTELKKYFRHKADEEAIARSISYTSGDWDGYIDHLRYSKVASGLFVLQRPKIEKRMGPLQVTDKRVFPRFRPPTTIPSAWKHQSAALQRMKAHSNGGGLLLAATGTGKTALAGMYFKDLIGSGLFIVDELYLQKQACKDIAAVMQEEVGVIGDGRFEPKRITVATVQTLHRYREHPKFTAWFKLIEVVVFDEVHQALNERSLEVLDTLDPKAVFGLTATLQMEDLETRMRAIELCGPPIFHYPIVQGQKDKILSEGKVLSVPFDSLWKFGGDYLQAVVTNVRRNRLIQSVTEQGHQAGRTTAVMVERRLHLDILHKQLGHIPHEIVTGTVKANQRVHIVEQMRQGSLPLVLASRVFFKGIDVPNLDMIVDGTGMPNVDGAVQRFGRGVRKAEGKQDLVYVDITDKIGNSYTDSSFSRIESWRKTGIPVTKLSDGDLTGLL